MKPSQITQILIRLFALAWLIHALAQVAGAVVMRSPPSVLLVPSLVVLVLAVVAWFSAPKIGRAITNTNDDAALLTQITFRQLLHAMFLGIGLFFCLSSLGDLLSNLYFFSVVKTAPEIIPDGVNISLYQVGSTALTFLAGLFVAFLAPKWAEKISGQ